MGGDGMPDFDSSDYLFWTNAIKLFHQSGYWSTFERKCEVCGTLLYPSELSFRCGEHRTGDAST